MAHNIFVKNMNESVLRDFFIGTATSDQLKQDLADAVIQIEPKASSQQIVDAVGEFQITSEHLVRLCDAVLAGELPPAELETIGFCLVSSDYFIWDGATPDGSKVADTIFDWSAPEINYPLTSKTTAKFKERLISGQNTFAPDDLK